MLELLQSIERRTAYLDRYLPPLIPPSRSTQIKPLAQALGDCVTAELRIPVEQQRVRVLIDQAADDVERQAREYQSELIEKQLTYFADVARWRLSALASLNTAQDWQLEKQRCASSQPFRWVDPWGATRETSGLLYWFARWAWTYDPRNSILKTFPFYLFPVQERTVERLEESVFFRRESLLIDKSRDMGITWAVADWDFYHWLFTPGFAALIGNRTEDEVDDSKGDMSATFNKLRFQLKLTPRELLPDGFDERRHCTFMNLTNPENGANIAGAAPVEDFGRGDRRTVIHPDEFASWQQSKGFKQWQAMSQTANSIIASSTVKGIFNKYGELLLDPNMPKFVVDWKDHPWKDERWYAQLKRGILSPPMTATDIAQEVDRDPYASQPGQVLTQYSPVHNIITVSEFERVYGKLREPSGEFRIPPRGWNVSAGQDVGTTPEHPNVTSYFVRPRELDPYPEFVFGVKEIVRVRCSTSQIADGIKDESGRLLTPGFSQYEKGQLEGCKIVYRVLSHEATNEQLCYAQDCEYKTIWSKWPGDASGGIEQIDNAMTLDPVRLNPFVIDPRTTDRQSAWAPYVANHFCDLCEAEHEGEHLKGCSRFFLVVSDDEGKLFVDGGGKLMRKPGRTEAGLARARFEAPGWHYPESEKGKPVKQRKPEKGNDDYWDSARMQLAYFILNPATASKEEKVIKKYEEKLAKAMKAVDPLDELMKNAVLQTNLIYRERDLAAADKSNHYLFQDETGGM